MAKTQGTSEDTKTIVTVLALLFAYPVGLIVMWVWPKWKIWLKILLTAPIFFIIIAFVLAFTAASIISVSEVNRGMKASQDGCNACANNPEMSTNNCATICANLTPTILPE